jgi:hypothetical protein
VNEYKDLGSWERRVCCTDGKLTEADKGTLMDIKVYSAYITFLKHGVPYL